MQEKKRAGRALPLRQQVKDDQRLVAAHIGQQLETSASMAERDHDECDGRRAWWVDHSGATFEPCDTNQYAESLYSNAIKAVAACRLW